MMLPLYLNKKNKYYKFGKRIIKERQIPRLDYKKIAADKTKPPIIFLEPHSDDIALSISGVLYNLYKKGHIINIINFFSYTPPEKSPWNGLFCFSEKDYESIRKIEDISAFRFLLGCNLKFLNLKSSQYRGYRLFFDKLKKKDSAIPEIEKEFSKLKRNFFKSKVFAPAGIGNHVDHILIRELAMKHFNNLYFYEDYPYCTRKKYYIQGINRLKKMKVKEFIEKINIKIKNKLINLYNSQLNNAFNKNKSEIKNYFGSIKNEKGYHERYWKFQGNL